MVDTLQGVSHSDTLSGFEFIFDGEDFGFLGSEASCSIISFSDKYFKSADMIRLNRGNTRDVVYFEGPTIHCSHCGSVFWYGERLYIRVKSKGPRLHLCCGHGKVKLPFLRDSPQLL